MGGASGALVLPLLIWTTFRLVNPLIELTNPVLAARTAVAGATQAQALMTAVFALAISLGNFLNGQLAENFGWMRRFPDCHSVNEVVLQVIGRCAVSPKSYCRFVYFDVATP